MNYDKELVFAIELARDAGEIARQHFSVDIHYEEKSDNSPVTVADTAINQLIIERVRDAYPGVGVLGEEESHHGSHDSWLWVCDPIDGTLPYSLGIPASTICIALVVNGQPEVGVVYDFNNDQLFSAVRGGQACLNDTPITWSDQKPMKLVNLEWYHAAAYDLSGVREKLFTDRFQVPNYASGAFSSMRVALGKVAGTIYSGDKAWDIAATKVIVEAAGGVVTDLTGKEQRYDRLIHGAVITLPEYKDYLIKLLAS